MISNELVSEESLEFKTAKLINQQDGLDCKLSGSDRVRLRSSMMLSMNRVDEELQPLLNPGKILLKWERISFLRRALKEFLIEFLTTDLKYCQSKGVEHKVWLLCFHNVIELLRKEFIKRDKSDIYKNLLISIIDDGVKYYSELLISLENNYKCEIKRLLAEGSSGYGRLAFSVQKVFIYLGDLERYKCFVNDTVDYKLAKEHYSQAALMDPKNGRSYNRLALISIMMGRNFDAIYYYVRCANAVNVYPGNRESMLACYDNIRMKYENSVRLKSELRAKRKKLQGREKLRHEVWILPDQDSDEDDEYVVTERNIADAKAKFLYSFIYVHGKLFLRVDMDQFQQRAVHMLTEFNALITYSPAALNLAKMLQILAISVHSVVNWKDRVVDKDDEYMADLSLIILFQTIGLLLKRSVRLLEEKVIKRWTECPEIVDEEINIYLATIAVWCDWLTVFRSGWNPLPCCDDYKVDDCKSCWPHFASLVNVLEKWRYEETMENRIYKKKIILANRFSSEVERVEIKLPELSFLSGFTPTDKDEQFYYHYYTDKDVDMEVARMCCRISKILNFAEKLCAVQPPVLELLLRSNENGDKQYVSVRENSPTISPSDDYDAETDNKGEKRLPSDGVSLDDCYAQEESERNMINDKENTNTGLLLSSEKCPPIKTFLQNKRDAEEKLRLQTAYEEEVNVTMRRLMHHVQLEITPRFIVLDTNTFVDCLAGIERIVEAVSKKDANKSIFTLLIPFIVLKELVGLKNGPSVEVRQGATNALNFLQSFPKKNIKYVTTLGSFLPSRVVFKEDVNKRVKIESNDDRILATCKNLCKFDKQFQNDDGTRVIHRQIVLLTRDRNLRIKACSNDIPSRDIIDFLKWANLN